MSSFLSLETMGNYGINLVPFWKMEEADWVVLRLLCYGLFSQKGDIEATKAQEYLFKKYGESIVRDCVKDLEAEID